jgi:hypothetical protein
MAGEQARSVGTLSCRAPGQQAPLAILGLPGAACPQAGCGRELQQGHPDFQGNPRTLRRQWKSRPSGGPGRSVGPHPRRAVERRSLSRGGSLLHGFLPRRSCGERRLGGGDQGVEQLPIGSGGARPQQRLGRVAGPQGQGGNGGGDQDGVAAESRHDGFGASAHQASGPSVGVSPPLWDPSTQS